MGKQYTFKTTRDTEWLEPILDELPSQDRSRTIRMALVLMFDNVRPAVLQRSHTEEDVTLEERPEVLFNAKFMGNTVSVTPDTYNEPVFEAIDEDLDSKLDKLDF